MNEYQQEDIAVIMSNIEKYYKDYLQPNNNNNYPISGKKYDEKEILSVVNAVLQCHWTEGEITKKFEKKFGNFLGLNHVLVTNSGSSANLIAMKTLTSKRLGKKKIIPGDEVITVACGFPTTIYPIIQSGAVPVFCDVEKDTLNIDCSQLEKCYNKEKTKAVFLAHTLGNPFNIKRVKQFCDKNKLWLIEDNCDALGSKYKKQYTGTFGDMSTFSFYPAHHITMGEGGAICTNNPLLYKIAMSFRDWGKDCYCRTGEDNKCKKRFKQKFGGLPHGFDHKYVYTELGYNLKNTDLNVAIGLAQLDKLEDFIKTRKKNFKMLYERLYAFKEYFILPKKTQSSEPSWFGFPLTIKENAEVNREELLKYLNRKGIGTRVLFAGDIRKQPVLYNNKNDIKWLEHPFMGNTEYIMKNTFWVGVNPLVNEEHIKYLEDCLDKFFNGDLLL